MSHNIGSGFSSEAEPTQKAPADSGAPPPPGPPWLSRWVAVIALAVALIAVVLAAWALLRPAKAGSPAATDPQVAKLHACSAFNTVRSAVALQTHADLGPDPVAVQAVAANARLSMAAGGSYLLARLDPGTPAPLAAGIRAFAGDLQEIAMNALAGVSNDDPGQSARLHHAQVTNEQIVALCK